MKKELQTLVRGQPTGKRVKFNPGSLKLRRMSAGLSAQQLSSLLERKGWRVSRRAIADWEAGRSTAPQGVVAPVASILKCSQIALLERAKLVVQPRS